MALRFCFANLYYDCILIWLEAVKRDDRMNLAVTLIAFHFRAQLVREIICSLNGF
jgi:hypothetical protein